MDNEPWHESAAVLLVLTEKVTIPSMRLLGAHQEADDLIKATQDYIEDPTNAAILHRAKDLGFLWGEDGD